VQNLQLSKGRQDSRGGGNDYQAFLEKQISKHLRDKYRSREVTIMNDVYCYTEVEDLDVDLQFLRIAFGDFSKIVVGKFGLHVSYSD
jgi:hypothetical protein